MIILGLTGSIAMGKSTAVKMLRDLGCQTQDADLIVHNLLTENKNIIKSIELIFPNVVENNIINRQTLGNTVFSNNKDLKKLEAILHPLVEAEQIKFLQKNATDKIEISVLEVPLLFETGIYKKCDKNILITASANIQKQRALKRPGMTIKKFNNIIAMQTPDYQKKKMADYIIDSSNGMDSVLTNLKDILNSLKSKTNQ